MSRVVTIFDPWKDEMCTCPPKYSCSPYTGCSHSCLYCYISSYIPNAFIARPKKNFIKRLARDIRRIDPRIPISMANSSDPYTPPEDKLRLTRRALEILIPKGLKLIILTKSTLVLRDIDLIKCGNVAVSITITTLDSNVAKIIEPMAPDPWERLKVVEKLSEKEIPVIVRVDPIIPYVNDDIGMLENVISEAIKKGAKHIVVSTYKARRDSLNRLAKAFPDIGKAIKEAYLTRGIKMKRTVYYLSKAWRKKVLKQLMDFTLKEGATFAVCREGFREYIRAQSCDGTHLIPNRVEPLRIA